MTSFSDEEQRANAIALAIDLVTAPLLARIEILEAFAGIRQAGGEQREQATESWRERIEVLLQRIEVLERRLREGRQA